MPSLPRIMIVLWSVLLVLFQVLQSDQHAFGFAIQRSYLRRNLCPPRNEVLKRDSHRTSSFATVFAKDGVLYRQSVCTKDEMESIQQELPGAMKSLTQEQSSIAQHRFGASISKQPGSAILDILERGSIYSLVQRAVISSLVDSSPKIRLSQNIPVEVRLYQKPGASMAWHQDDILYDPPQIEIVFTVENTSDCATLWKVEHGLHSQETHPNSLLMLQAGGPEHCVTSLRRGRRVILKCAYIMEGATFLGGENYKYQFGESKTTSGSQKKKKKR
ncbi:hypothetical protein IV203_016110 [Nitzschia inconspicua]|uniref:Fe2OG dioxygenase domain-containing protein n=1 Tax=Nitzschia inconspicua TaxID=303405 RepID=A0A9K3KPF2_9STRA|nr:hypothetical protein IV203_016110 [Nitzschia inconspicua]